MKLLKPILVICGIFVLSSIRSFAQEATEELSAPELPATGPAATAVPPKLIDTIDFKDTDISDVLKYISQKTGRNVVAGNTVTGKVTLYLKNVNIDDVLKILAQSNDLAYVATDNLIQVMTSAEFEKAYGHSFQKRTGRMIQKLTNIPVSEIMPVLSTMKSPSGTIVVENRSNTIVIDDLPLQLYDIKNFLAEVDVPRQTRIFELSYAKVEDLAEKINPLLTPSVGILNFDKRSNKITVMDLPSRLADIERVVSAYDVREKQVSIEARIVQVILSDQFKMGIDWQAVVSDYHDLTFTNSLALFGSTDKKGKISIGTIETDKYTATIEALKQFGETRNLSSPHIIAVNNQEAKLLVGSNQPYVTSTTSTPSSGPTTVSESVNFIEVGVKLFVTPTVHNDGYVTMKIKPEVSSVTSTLTTSTNNSIPVVDTSEAETTVLVRDGATIVIGGLIKDEKLNTDKKIPILGSIPLLGHAFKSQDHLTRKTELVIFLTPQIIRGDNDTPSVSQKKTMLTASEQVH